MHYVNVYVSFFYVLESIAYMQLVLYYEYSSILNWHLFETKLVSNINDLLCEIGRFFISLLDHRPHCISMCIAVAAVITWQFNQERCSTGFG